MYTHTLRVLNLVDLNLPAVETISDVEPAPADAAAASSSHSATLRANLVAQGLDDAAINTILEHRWAGSTATGHDSV